MNSFFPNVINEWNKLDTKIINITSDNTFKNSLLSFIRPVHCDTFKIHGPTGLQLLTRLRMGICHLNEHKFKDNFRDFLNPLCACKLELVTKSHYLLRCHLFQTERRTLLNDIKEIDESIITDHKNDLDLILLYGNGRYRYNTNRMILLSTITFCIAGLICLYFSLLFMQGKNCTFLKRFFFEFLLFVSNYLLINTGKPVIFDFSSM